MKTPLLVLSLLAAATVAHAQSSTNAPRTGKGSWAPPAAALPAPPLSAPSPRSGNESLDRIVAVVDEDVVLQSELDRQMKAVTAQYANTPGQLPPQDVLQRQILDRIILQKLQIARAEASGIKASDAEIDQALAQIARQNNMDVGQLRGTVEAQGLDFDPFRKNIADQVVVQHLRQGVAQSRVQISDAEVDSLVKNGRVDTGQIHLGYILIGIPDGASPTQIDDAQKRAAEAKRKIDGGMDFAAAAIRYSNSDNALQGGDLGWRSRNELPPALIEVADGLAEGAVSDPIRGPNGFHLIKLIGKRAGSGSGQIDREEAKNILFQRKAEDEYESFLRQLRSEAYVEIRLPGGDKPAASTP